MLQRRAPDFAAVVGAEDQRGPRAEPRRQPLVHGNAGVALVQVVVEQPQRGRSRLHPLGGGIAVGGGGSAKKPARAATKKSGAAASGDAVTSPMQGTIVKVVVEEGQQVAEGDTVVVIEAMKMEQPLKAHKAGTVTGLEAEVGRLRGRSAS